MKYPIFSCAFGACALLLGITAVRAQDASPAATISPDVSSTVAASPTPVAPVPSVTPTKQHERAVSSKALEKYDANKNGVLDPEEKAAMKKDRQARRDERLKKYDKNGDGKLDDTEKAAMKADKKANKGL